MLARYLAKYLSKDLSLNPKGIHRYKRSRGIVTPQEVLLLPYDAAIDAELLSQFQARGANLRYCQNRLDQEGPKWLWVCSW
jgi:hypothetical protein